MASPVKSIVLFCSLLVACLPTNAQLVDETHFEFEALQPIDTIYDDDVILKIREKDAVKKTNCFFTEKYADTIGWFLIEREKDKWIVYDLNSFVSILQYQNIKCLQKILWL